MTRNGTSQLLQRRERAINLRLERQEIRRQDEAANDQMEALQGFDMPPHDTKH